MSLIVFLFFMLAVAPAGAGSLPDHPALLGPLTPECTFPRFTREQLESAGYPDHKHVFSYPWYEPFIDEEGVTYGALSLRDCGEVIPRDGLFVHDDEILYRQAHIRFDFSRNSFQILPMVEFVDWAMRELTALLDYDYPDTLLIDSPDDLNEYRNRTGFGFHRLYHDDGEVIIVSPVQILTQRTLASHAAFHMTAARLIRDMAAHESLPAWLVDGLASYLAEDGIHFLSYVARYRGQRPVILSPDQTESILSDMPHEDEGIDLYQYRVAGYSAFLMAWELVEHRGGLAPVRELLTRVGSGEPIDAVCKYLYGHDLAGLTADLDPTKRPEPVGEAWRPGMPHLPPGQ